MKQYKAQKDGSLNISGMHIPVDTNNRHYAKALEEIAKGDAEIVAYSKPVNEDLDNEILVLEASQTYRRLREAILTPTGKAWLQDVENQIKTLRNQKV